MVREVVKATGDIITVAGDHIQGYTGDGGPPTDAELFLVGGITLTPWATFSSPTSETT